MAMCWNAPRADVPLEAGLADHRPRLSHLLTGQTGMRTKQTKAQPLWFTLSHLLSYSDFVILFTEMLFSSMNSTQFLGVSSSPLNSDLFQLL